jgi:AcrR family transcriptional regulator
MRDEPSSKHRLRAAAKALFAEQGYEATTIADITRAARTSHSQFLKYYSGKEELRREIIEEQWSELNRSVALALSCVSSATEKLTLALNMLITLLENDRKFRAILLLEQTGIRRGGELTMDPEFRTFVAILDDIIAKMKEAGELQAKVDGEAFRSAIIGSIEGMMRDQLMAVANFAAHYSVERVRSTLSVLIASVAEVQMPSINPQRGLSDGTITVPTEDDWIRYYLKLADRALLPSDLS